MALRAIIEAPRRFRRQDLHHSSVALLMSALPDILGQCVDELDAGSRWIVDVRLWGVIAVLDPAVEFHPFSWR